MNQSEPQTSPLFRRNYTTEHINKIHEGSVVERLGIEFTEVGPDFLRARMPVDDRTRQPLGVLHGGSSVVLAETLASLAGIMCTDEGWTAVGLDINANHLRAVREGWVSGICRPVHVGRNTQVWQIDITDDRGRTVCVSRMTSAVIPIGRV
jgi:1,4-dihydroxy-2-naphthoyl-CoA hydrolase